MTKGTVRHRAVDFDFTIVLVLKLKLFFLTDNNTEINIIFICMCTVTAPRRFQPRLAQTPPLTMSGLLEVISYVKFIGNVDFS